MDDVAPGRVPDQEDAGEVCAGGEEVGGVAEAEEGLEGSVIGGGKAVLGGFGEVDGDNDSGERAGKAGVELVVH